MATISSIFKMQDNATKTFNSVANAMDSVIDKAEELSNKSSNLGAGVSSINPALNQAVSRYNQLISKQEQINAKIDMMRRQEQFLVQDLNREKSAYNQNEKAIFRIEKSLMNVRNQKENLINQSNRLTDEIWEQASAVNAVADNTGKIKSPQDKMETGFSKWQTNVIAFNQALQLTQSIARGVGKVLNFSDDLTLTKARLDMINDGTQTTAELQNKLYAAAKRSRGAYDDMSKSVAKLGLLAGDSFKSNDEMIAFSELLNKSFKVSGAGQQEISSATYQLTQAMAAGKLQGDEFRSITENAPMLADAIAKYMGKSKGELKELSSEGVITADIIKNALFQASGDINEKFDTMPKTFGDAMTNIKNTTQRYMQPVANKITEMLNSEKFNTILNNILAGIRWFAGFAYKSFQMVGNIITFFRNNLWLTIPLLTLLASIIGINLVTALSVAIPKIWAVVAGWMAAHWQVLAIIMVFAIAIGIMASLGFSLEQMISVLGILATVLIAIKIAIWLVNAALYANPIVWIIVLIVAVIAVILLLIGFIGNLVDSSHSAIGYICGALNVAVAFIWNLFLALLDLVLGVINAMVNPWISFANFIGNLFNDPIGAVVHLFGDMADRVLGILETIAKALDKVFGSNLAGTVKGWRKGLDDMVKKVANKYGNGSYEKVAEELNLSSESLGLKRMEYGNSWESGLKFGDNLSNKISGGIGSVMDSLKGLGGGIEDMLGNPEDFGQGYDMSKFMDGNGNLPVDVKKNSDKEVDISDEDLKMLKDIATRDYMLNYKHITPNVNIQFGDVKETADINAIKDELDKMMQEELSELYVVEEA